MLVDDEVEQSHLRACIIASCGYQVITAHEPHLAMRLAADEALDLAILDYEMPGMNGVMLADRLRATMPALKIVLYSGVVAITENDIEKVDLFISKADGIFYFLRCISDLLKPEH
jgi:CheY-like chemotaxis protein